jgi:hypothetical protein
MIAAPVRKNLKHVITGAALGKTVGEDVKKTKTGWWQQAVRTLMDAVPVRAMPWLRLC